MAHENTRTHENFSIVAQSLFDRFLVGPLIDAGQLPADTNTVLAALVESKRGEQMVIYNAFPAVFKAQAKELRQMIEEGLLNEPNMIP